MKKFVLILSFIFTFNLFAQDTLIFHRDYIPWPDTTLVFLPHQQKPVIKLPLLFLLHGWAGTYRQWNREINLQDYADNYGWIIVTPDGFYNSWYVNSPRKKNCQFETFF